MDVARRTSAIVGDGAELQADDRERRVFIVYGTLAVLYIIELLGFIALALGG